MGAPMGAAAGLLAGLLGAAAWAAIAYFGNIEIGYLAWGIGGLVGFAVARGAGQQGPMLGAIAVVITVLSICGGKLATIDLLIQDELANAVQESADLSPEDFEEPALVSRIADKLVAEREEAGEEIEWPENQEVSSLEDLEELEASQFYPEDIWAEAEQRWQSMSDQEQGALRQQAASEARQLAEEFGEQMRGVYLVEAFKGSFGIIDIVFFGLGIVTAWGFASSQGEDTGAEAPAE